jgi:hypothetical protein
MRHIEAGRWDQVGEMSLSSAETGARPVGGRAREAWGEPCHGRAPPYYAHLRRTASRARPCTGLLR